MPVAQRVTSDDPAPAPAGSGRVEGDDASLPEGLLPADDAGCPRVLLRPTTCLTTRTSIRWPISNPAGRAALDRTVAGRASSSTCVGGGTAPSGCILDPLRLHAQARHGGGRVERPGFPELSPAWGSLSMPCCGANWGGHRSHWCQIAVGERRGQPELRAAIKASWPGRSAGSRYCGRWAWVNSNDLEGAVAPSLSGGRRRRRRAGDHRHGRWSRDVPFWRIGFFNASAWSFLFLPMVSGIAFASLSKNMPEGSWWTAEPGWWASVVVPGRTRQARRSGDRAKAKK